MSDETPDRKREPGHILTDMKPEEPETVYVVVSYNYDQTNVEGVYVDEDTAREAIARSNDAYTYGVREHDLLTEAERHDPYF